MKTKIHTLLLTLAISASSLPAANIAFVSFHAADEIPSGAAATAGFTNAPDIGYTTLLAGNGHNVTRFVTVNDIDTQPDLIAALNTNDLVIIGRSVNSGHYEVANETAAWNGITKPMMVLGGYVTRNVRLGMTTGGTMVDANVDEWRLRVNAPAHPIFAGVALDGTSLMVNPYARRTTFTNASTGVETLQNGVSINNNPIVAGGSVLAVNGTAGSGGVNGLVIGEMTQGITASHGREVFAARRLVFLSGSREAGITSEGSGIYDLFADGEQLFLNAVTYLTTPQVPKATLPLVGATNLVAGDSWTFTAGVIGDTPLTYQWYKDGVALPTETAAALTFASLDSSTHAGEYQLFITNASGWATSTLAQLEFAVFPPTSITNGLISYWPLDQVQGAKTFDVVSTYDMSLVNMSAADVVPGKFGNAFHFNGTNALLERINNPGDGLPIYNNPNFTVSLWVNGIQQSDRRVFSEGSLTSGSPLFNIGTHNTGADGTVDIYIRGDSGATVGDHRHSVATAFDGFNWYNIVYVQRDIGGGNMRAQLWVDGVLDSVVITPVRPLTARATSIGAIRRAAASAWFNGLIDEVAVWNRALSSDEVQILQVTAITNAPVRPQPLVISSFKADLPAVVPGASTVLRWEINRDAAQITLNGADVAGNTQFGAGSISVAPNANATYVLTIGQGGDSLSATTSVAVVEGVNPGWAVLDTFDQAQPGNLFDSGYWNDTSGNGGQVVSVNGNNALRATSAGISFLNLQELSVLETQVRTLFFRMIPGADNAAAVTNLVGLTDKSQRGYGDAFANIGPVLYATAFTNVDYAVETNGWYLGVRNGPGGPIDYIGNQTEAQKALDSGGVYNIWVDITNAPAGDPFYMNDMFTVYIQKEGGGPRTVLFQDYLSDRDLFFVDVVLGGFTPNLDKLVVMGNSATVSATFDDFYLSTGGYNATVPKPYTIVSQPGPLSVNRVGNQIQIIWTTGTLQSSANVTGPYVDVPGNPTSPYLVDPAGNGMFYRARQ